MPPAQGTRGIARSEHNHHLEDEHRRTHTFGQGHGPAAAVAHEPVQTYTSMSQKDRPGQERLKRKISSKLHIPAAGTDTLGTTRIIDTASGFRNPSHLTSQQSGSSNSNSSSNKADTDYMKGIQTSGLASASVSSKPQRNHHYQSFPQKSTTIVPVPETSQNNSSAFTFNRGGSETVRIANDTTITPKATKTGNLRAAPDKDLERENRERGRDTDGDTDRDIDDNRYYRKARDPMSPYFRRDDGFNQDLQATVRQHHYHRIKRRLTPAEEENRGIDNDRHQGRELDHNHAGTVSPSSRLSHVDSKKEGMMINHNQSTNRAQILHSNSSNGVGVIANMGNDNKRKEGECLTIRDILDSQELRDQLSELRRSQNSNSDSRQRLQPQQQYKQRIEESAVNVVEGAGAAAEAALTSRICANSATIDDNTDESILERKSRPRLSSFGQGSSPLTRADFARQPPISNPQKTFTSAVVTGSPESRMEHGTVLPTERQRRDLYHSSYSPSDFSPNEGNDNDDDSAEEEYDQDTVELQPGATAVKAPLKNDMNSAHSPKNILSSAPKQPQLTLSNFNTINNKLKKDDRLGGLEYDSGELSFEREVAIARAKRELGMSASTDNKRVVEHVALKPITETALGKPTSPMDNSNNYIVTPRTTASRLDHGRDLVLEDLVSPTRYDFISRQRQQQQQQQQQRHLKIPVDSTLIAKDGPKWRSSPGFPPLSTAEDLSKLDIAENRFMELAGSLGEGQAVSSLLGTLKAMIRQLKSEKRSITKANKKLLKELERQRKKNEKLSKATAVASSPSRRAKGQAFQMGTTVTRPEKQEIKKTAGIQREKDQVQKELESLQKRIDALELQRAEVQKCERRYAAEEADLLFLMNSSDDDNEEETESDSDDGSGSSSEDQESEQEVSDVDAQSRRISVYRRPGRGSDRRGARDLQVSPQAHRASSTKRPSMIRGSSDSSSKIRKEKKYRVLREHDHLDTFELSGGQEQPSSLRGRSRSVSRGARSKSMNPESRRFVEKVEEVHIHHHVHYGPDGKEMSIPATILRSKTNELDGNGEAPSQLQQEDCHHHGQRSLEDLEEGVHRLQIGTPFKPHSRKPAGQNHHYLLDIPMPSIRGGTFLSQSLPGQGSHLDKNLGSPRPKHTIDRLTHTINGLDIDSQTNVRIRDSNNSRNTNCIKHKGDENNDDDDRSAYPAIRMRSKFQQPRSMSLSRRLQDDIKSGRKRARALAAALTDPSPGQKKISIDVQRILSLLKTHDPRRCTVCCNGGNGTEIEKHHHHQQMQFEEDDRSQQYQRQQHSRSALLARSAHDTRNVKPSTTTTIRREQLRPTAPPTLVVSSSALNPSSKRAKSNGDNNQHTITSDDDADNIGSESEVGASLSSISDDNQRSIAANGGHGEPSPTYQRSGSREHPHRGQLEQQGQQEGLALASIRTKKESTRSDGFQTPEQKLSVVLGQLENEVKHLRKSYFELSKDLKTLSQTSINMEDGIAGDGSGSNSRNTNDSKKDLVMVSSSLSSYPKLVAKTESRSEVLEEQLRQKKKIRKQLEEVADSLAEKADLIMRLQQQYIKQREKEQQRQNGRQDRSQGRGQDREIKPTDYERDGDRNSAHMKGKRQASLSRVGIRHKDEEAAYPMQDKEEPQMIKKMTEEDTCKLIEEQGSTGEYGDLNDNQDLVRSHRHHQNRQRKYHLEKHHLQLGEVEVGEQRRDNEQGLEGLESEEQKKQKQPAKKSGLKEEPEGYRHRLANGIRVPMRKIH
ncbi:hypothetical protein BCR41DRAFT_383223 [Lobosporangium transversale]|uniref:Uncharacterized protein n=1 Tax=Lobosporangium transversale TaxID=64571 RepID=A0A1Y2H1I8_9FUNG|nr:hypothetical protein BCR41DRAFT_383223 [Lobosporangium transversale]ORZ28396.1 hypothetical protein BCR41DRAFT_383223 [Lobosporangium transversale]|eukprot:XP_021886081.1 hypothetical protein BCR41DRAFT_383223 [Lobosporangium transversale]